ncbi:MAG: hypothetical protein M1133_09320 [Armatimonadetes bacterium]|nr:hypothetical protein [Armatimonadota bacterium]
MRSRLFTAILAIVFIAILSSATFAQYEDRERGRFGIRFIDFRPSNSVLKSVNANWIGPSLDYNLFFDKLDRPTWVISLGWLSESSGSGSGRYVPVTATYLKHLSDVEGKGFYIGAGAGVYYNKVDTSIEETIIVGGQSQRVAFATSGSQNKFGVNLLGGYEFGAWYAELRYDKMGKLSMSRGPGIDFSGLTLSFGTRMAF